jgi:hypothetical protein
MKEEQTDEDESEKNRGVIYGGLPSGRVPYGM